MCTPILSKEEAGGGGGAISHFVINLSQFRYVHGFGHLSLMMTSREGDE